MMVKVAAHEAVNSMSVRAISVVIAPTLLKAPKEMENEMLMNYMTNAPAWLAKLVNDCIAAAPTRLLEPPRPTGLAKLRDHIKAVSHRFSALSALSRQGDSNSELASHRSMPTSSGKQSQRPSMDQNNLSFSAAVSRAAKSFTQRRPSDSMRKPSLHGKRGSVTPVEAPETSQTLSPMGDLGDLSPVVEGSSSRLLGNTSKDSSALLRRAGSESKASEDSRGVSKGKVTFGALGGGQELEAASPKPALANVVSSGLDGLSNTNLGTAEDSEKEMRFPSKMSLWSASCEDSQASECSSRMSVSRGFGSACSSQLSVSDAGDEGPCGTDDSLHERRRARKLSLRAADALDSGRDSHGSDETKPRRQVERPPKASVFMKLKKSRMHSGLGVSLVDSAAAVNLKECNTSCSSQLVETTDEAPRTQPDVAEVVPGADGPPTSVQDNAVTFI